jgi:flagellar export protein FliJ
VTVFNFRLAAVLRYRKRVEEEKQWEIDGLIAARAALEREIQGLNRRLADAAKAVTGEEGQILAPLQLRLYGDYARQLTQLIKDRESVLKQCDENIALKRRELIDAMRAVKALEQLRSRLEEKFRRAQNIEEQKLADEMSQRKFADPQTRKKVPW